MNGISLLCVLDFIIPIFPYNKANKLKCLVYLAFFFQLETGYGFNKKKNPAEFDPDICNFFLLVPKT